MAPILTRNDYMYFFGNESIQKIPDPKDRSNVIEFLLAKTMVVRTLGRAWWNAAQEEINAFTKGIRLDHPAIHPLTRFATAFGEKEVTTRTWGQLVLFAADMLILADKRSSDLDSKIPELRAASSFSQFSQAWFELRVAGNFLRNGIDMRFLTEAKKERRPDMVAKFRETEVFVECEVRGELALEERKSERTYLKNLPRRLSATENLLEDACKKVVPRDVPYLVAIRIDRPAFSIFSLELKQLRSSMETIMIRNPHVSSVVFFSAVVAEDETGVSFGDDITFTPNLNPDVPLPIDFVDILTTAKPKPPPEYALTSYALKH